MKPYIKGLIIDAINKVIDNIVSDSTVKATEILSGLEIEVDEFDLVDLAYKAKEKVIKQTLNMHVELDENPNFLEKVIIDCIAKNMFEEAIEAAIAKEIYHHLVEKGVIKSDEKPSKRRPS